VPQYLGGGATTGRAAVRGEQECGTVPGARGRGLNEKGRDGERLAPFTPSRPLPVAGFDSLAYLTSWLSLKIGRMMLIAMKPTMPPMITIIRGSIIAVTLLMTIFSSRE
jgi:hypothetical protein